ncbi:MAG: hypothetical protein LQ343_000794 [Gyalolechia ehrenbergii]|nr:MAG: hypothetical protein LQ343_000794 [Gyalolechia ehrenbergii]
MSNRPYSHRRRGPPASHHGSGPSRRPQSHNQRRFEQARAGYFPSQSGSEFDLDGDTLCGSEDRGSDLFVLRSRSISADDDRFDPRHSPRNRGREQMSSGYRSGGHGGGRGGHHGGRQRQARSPSREPPQHHPDDCSNDEDELALVSDGEDELAFVSDSEDELAFVSDPEPEAWSRSHREPVPDYVGRGGSRPGFASRTTPQPHRGGSSRRYGAGGGRVHIDIASGYDDYGSEDEMPVRRGDEPRRRDGRRGGGRRRREGGGGYGR